METEHHADKVVLMTNQHIKTYRTRLYILAQPIC